MTAAGIVENFTAFEYPTPKIKKLMDINVMGTWYASLEAAKLMPHGGSIIMVGSMSGEVRHLYPSRATTADMQIGSKCPSASNAIQCLQCVSLVWVEWY